MKSSVHVPPRAFDPDQVWPWDNRASRGPSPAGALLALGLYAALGWVFCRGLVLFQTDVVLGDGDHINTLMHPVVGPVRLFRPTDRVAPLRYAGGPVEDVARPEKEEAPTDGGPPDTDLPVGS